MTLGAGSRVEGGCELCPRRCRVDRRGGQLGFCGETDQMRIAAIEAHLGEEPPISGQNGSGTVFFTGCSLRCHHCQNHQISREGLGRPWTGEEVAQSLARLYATRGIHNVNFVTPDHFFPQIVTVVRRLRELGVAIPMVYNLSGYQRAASLRMIEPWADIYLPDFKYADAALAQNLSHCPDYARVALDAVAEMIRQRGFLDVFSGDSGDDDGVALARRGVLVRHLILPGQIRNSLDALTMLFLEFGPGLPLSLMSQYVPVGAFPADSALNRTVTREEFDAVLQHALSLGFRHLFVQEPEEGKGDLGASRPFLPDFSQTHPFPGNRTFAIEPSRIPVP